MMTIEKIPLKLPANMTKSSSDFGGGGGSDCMIIRYRVFASLTNGGFMRDFEALDYPGIYGMTVKKHRRAEVVTKWFFEDQEVGTPEKALKAWLKKNGVNKK